ncbi:D-glycero-beta-D-manno-heptose-7-phosphate kinase [Leeia sp. TBRC 13508]|uniref:D-glycero-beta-D-manno-heptose-7-phosphate kinase n=1 Tax=Leeia speluncae TaxID=2884804 RepID=A0ABS8D685_9NEIS|nr:D-glycero-beta-D-manno-heptose-7-phosphate kinase [Leeia speluncae]MCB6183729.1 D-glycero-beta-D-manno-heptose-7-phosphate kinase [Leeia speluncae]
MDLSLSTLKQRLTSAKVLVVGDVMLDRYWFGEVNRISPEAPVPVVKVESVEERPGGAANVAKNIAALGGQTGLLSVVGDDEPASALEKLLVADQIDAGLLRDASLVTTVKLRVIGRQQQLIRIDFETMPSHEVLAAKLADFEARLPNVDVVILSDYGKGGLTHIRKMIELARAAGKPVLVDPKGADWSRYEGATLITPNRSEFKEVAGGWSNEEELIQKANAVRERFNLEGLLVTRSEEGMTLFLEGATFHQPTFAREVFDVTGAGDTVIATLGLMLAAGESMQSSVEWANRAAGIVVGKLGTAVALPEELLPA